jgi:hypothetical protein
LGEEILEGVGLGIVGEGLSFLDGDTDLSRNLLLALGLGVEIGETGLDLLLVSIKLVSLLEGFDS